MPWNQTTHPVVPFHHRSRAYCRTPSPYHHAPVGTNLVSVRPPHQILARLFGPCRPASTYYSSLISTPCFLAARLIRFLIVFTSS